MIWIGYVLIAAGVAILIASLFPVWRMIGLLPSGSLRRNWYILTGLILLFIAGYLGYAFFKTQAGFKPEDLLVTLVFFCGAIFVLLVNQFSLQTAMDLQRITALEHETITDPLMGIFNRRYLERRLREEVSRSQRYHLPMSILLMDIDHFKDLNDTWGHPTGDQVLIQLGKLVMNTVRFTDIVARYGGDELLIIAPNTPSTAAVQLGERLRLAVEDAPFAFSENAPDQILPYTISIGIAILGSDHRDGTALLASADEALYGAKRDGRNRVEIAKTGSAIYPEPQD
jgi:diguanylate cyclase (GGDEF)-like protein